MSLKCHLGWTAAPPTAWVAFSSWSYISNPNLVKMQWCFPWVGTLGKQAGFIPSKIRQSTCPLHHQTSRILTMERTSSSVLSARPGETKPALLSSLSWSCRHVVGSQPSLGLGRANDLTGLYNDNLHSSFRGIISVHSHHKHGGRYPGTVFPDGELRCGSKEFRDMSWVEFWISATVRIQRLLWPCPYPSLVLMRTPVFFA